jgi:hypothetical protein
MLVDRMIRAARLDVHLYEEVENDPSLTGQAATVVAIVAVCAGIGNAIFAIMNGLPGQAVTLMRAIGFAQSPAVLAVLVFIPCLGILIAVAAAIWSLIAGVIAIRQALDFDSGKALLTAFLGWLALVVVNVILRTALGIKIGSR